MNDSIDFTIYRREQRIKEALESLKRDCQEDPLIFEFIDVRLQYVDGLLSVHQGDPSFDTDHRGSWGAACVTPDCIIQEVYNDLTDDLLDFHAMFA